MLPVKLYSRFWIGPQWEVPMLWHPEGNAVVSLLAVVEEWFANVLLSHAKS